MTELQCSEKSGNLLSQPQYQVIFTVHSWALAIRNVKYLLAISNVADGFYFAAHLELPHAFLLQRQVQGPSARCRNWHLECDSGSNAWLARYLHDPSVQ